MTNREIDALIATKVMGWTPDAQHPNLRGLGWWEDSLGSYTCELPKFSTDPTASKQLRDKMRADGYRFTLWDIPATESLRVRCTIVKSILDGETWQQVSDTEEMAVALAALKAVGSTE